MQTPRIMTVLASPAKEQPAWPARSGVAAAFLAGLGALLVTTFAWHGADLPNQVYRSAMFSRYGMLTFDTSWYGGHYSFTYSLLTPVLASVLGLRLLGAVSAVACSVAYSRLVRAELDRSRAWSAAVFAVGTAVPLLIGELAFSAGMAIGLWALAMLQSRRRVLAAVLATACTLTSPLSGLFLVLAMAAWVVADPDQRRARVAILVAATAPLLVSAVAFPEAGDYRFPVQQLVAVLVCSAVGWFVIPARATALRVGSVLYGVLALALFVVANPVGGNIVRLGSFLAPALVVAVGWPQRRRIALVLLLPALFWQWSTGVYAVADARNDPTRSEAYFQPLVEQVARLRGPVRLEIPFTNQHWEAAYVAPTVPLARGWERQLDVARNGLFYDQRPLDAAAYREWLYDNGVTAVALPDSELDMAGKKEAALIGKGLPYLTPVWHNAHWTLWTVAGSPGLVSGPADLSVTSPGSFVLDAERPATVTVRYRFTRTWSVTAGRACVESTVDGWTRVRVLAAGRVSIDAKPFSGSSDCPTQPHED